VVVVRDLDTSLRFYRDGLGLDVLLDREVEGDWPGLFDGPSRILRAVFLGDANVPDVTAGVLELNSFVGADVPTGLSPPRPTTGFFMLSYFVDVEVTLERLAELGVAGPVRRVTQATANGEITIAIVRDPDGVRVLLTPGSLAQTH
jgi:catechol 2,3-dioxygenase-like lactoylglutathione lyase family enzyme